MRKSAIISPASTAAPSVTQRLSTWSLQLSWSTLTNTSFPISIIKWQYRKWQYDRYDQYPTEFDKDSDTIFLIIKVKDASGQEVVVGGRRVTFPKTYDSPTISNYPVKKLPEIFKGTDDNPRYAREYEIGTPLNLLDVIPALGKDSALKYAEIGAFAIDQDTTRVLLKPEEYREMRAEVFKKSLDVAHDNNIDVVGIYAQEHNLSNQVNWLESQDCKSGKDYIVLSGAAKVRGLEDAQKALLVNISKRYAFLGKDGILRVNQRDTRTQRGR